MTVYIWLASNLISVRERRLELRATYYIQSFYIQLLRDRLSYAGTFFIVKIHIQSWLLYILVCREDDILL